MFSNIILLENDAELLQFYSQALADHGFERILALPETTDIVAKVEACYTQPTILVSDYIITPIAPSVFLPRLREKKINIPVVIVSGKVKFNQLNSLSLRCSLAGYFEKGVGSERMVNDLAQHLVDLNGEAIEAWSAYELSLKARDFASAYRQDQRAAMVDLLNNKQIKTIAADRDIHEDTVGRYKKELHAFLGTSDVPRRYTALYNALKAD